MRNPISPKGAMMQQSKQDNIRTWRFLSLIFLWTTLLLAPLLFFSRLAGASQNHQPQLKQETTLSGSTCGTAVFNDDFESGDTSAWSASLPKNLGGSNFLQVNGTAALNNNFGLEIVLSGGTNIATVQDNSPNDLTHYRARFLFDPNSITMTSGDQHELFHGNMSGGPVNKPVVIEFGYTNPTYQLRAGIADDNSVMTYTQWVPISDTDHEIEFSWQTATAIGANNGRLRLWIDNNLEETLSGIDNDTQNLDTIRLGALAGIDSSTNGSYYLDDFTSSNSPTSLDMAISNTVTPTQVTFGEILTYTIVLNNQSAITANIVMSDVLNSTALSYTLDSLSCINGQGTCSYDSDSKSVHWNGNIAPGVCVSTMFTATYLGDGAKMVNTAVFFDSATSLSGSAIAIVNQDDNELVYLPIILKPSP